jgi:hypothetical protein
MARERIERLWIGGGTVAAVLVAAVAWMVVVNPKLSDASSLRSQTDAANTGNSVLQTKIDKLQQDKANLGALQKSLADAQAALPPDSGLAAFTRQIGEQAAAAHVTVTSITASAPAPVGGASPASAAAASDTATTPAASSSAAPAPAAGASAATAPHGAYAIPVTIAVTGSQAADLRFLQGIQTGGGRAVLVTSTQLSGSGTDATGGTTLTIQLQAFAVPQPVQATSTAAVGSSSGS